MHAASGKSFLLHYLGGGVSVLIKICVVALAAVTFLRSCAGFGFPLFAPTMYEALGYGKGDTILACVAIVIGCPAYAIFTLLCVVYSLTFNEFTGHGFSGNMASGSARQVGTLGHESLHLCFVHPLPLHCFYASMIHFSSRFRTSLPLTN